MIDEVDDTEDVALDDVLPGAIDPESERAADFFGGVAIAVADILRELKKQASSRIVANVEECVRTALLKDGITFENLAWAREVKTDRKSVLEDFDMRELAFLQESFDVKEDERVTDTGRLLDTPAVPMSTCNKCGAKFPSAPRDHIHKCGQCSGGMMVRDDPNPPDEFLGVDMGHLEDIPDIE